MARINRPPAKTGRIVLFCIAEAALLWGLWWGATRCMEGMNRTVNDISELKDPSPFRAALMGYLGKIHIGLDGYLRSPDAAVADQVAQSEKDFTSSLPEFERQNPRLFPKIATEEINRTFAGFKEAIEHTLETNTRRMARRTTLDQNFARIILIIERNIRPLIRREQPDGEERSQAILNVVNQARAWQQNLEAAWSQPTHAAMELTYENDNRGATYLERYARLDLLPRERKLLKELQTLWEANSNLARESFAMEKVVSESKTFMDSQRQQVVQALNKYLPALPPAEFEVRKNALVRAIRIDLACAVALGVLAFLSLTGGALAAYRWNRGIPLWTPRKPAEKDPKAAPLKETTVEMDLKGTISHWSPAAEVLYGYSANEMRGKSISRLFESESEISRLYLDLLERPQTTFETIHKIKGGNAIPIKIEFRPITDNSGRATAIGLICTRR